MRPGPTLFILIETLGILSFAFSAMIVAKRKELSMLGIFVAAAATAFGGIIRDVLVNEFPSALKSGGWGLEAAFLGSAVAILMRMSGIEQPWALLGGFVATAAIRTIVVVRGQAAKAAKA